MHTAGNEIYFNVRAARIRHILLGSKKKNHQAIQLSEFKIAIQPLLVTSGINTTDQIYSLPV